MQLCGQYGHPALAVKVNQSVDYFSPTDSWVISGTVHSSVTQTFDCVTVKEIRLTSELIMRSLKKVLFQG